MTKSVLLRLRNLLLFGSVMALAWQGVDSIKVKPRGRQLSASQSLKKVRVPVDGQHWMRRRKWKKKCMGKQCDGEGYYKKKVVPVLKKRWRPLIHGNGDDHDHEHPDDDRFVIAPPKAPTKPPVRVPPPVAPPTRPPVAVPPPLTRPPTPVIAPTLAPVAAPPTLRPTSEPPTIFGSTAIPTSMPIQDAMEGTLVPTMANNDTSTTTASPVATTGRNTTEVPVSSGNNTVVPTMSPVIVNGTDSNATDTNATAPVGPPDQSIELRPPQIVIETTSAPTTSPTREVTPSLETRSIASKTLTFRAAGTTDLGSAEVTFFEEIEKLLAPIAQSEIGSMLTKFLLSIVFEHDKLEVVSIGLTGQNTLYRSVFQITARFDVEGAIDAVNDFDGEDATNLLRGLFEGTNKNRLLLFLANKGIRISSFDEIVPKEEPSNGDSADGGDTDPSADDTPPAPPIKTKKKDSNRNVLFITLFAGSLVIFALGLAMLVNNRRRRRFYYYGEQAARAGAKVSSDETQSEPSIADMSDSGGSKVQRAAGANKSYNSSDFLKRDATMVSGLEPMLGDVENEYATYYTSPSYDEEAKAEFEALDPQTKPLQSRHDPSPMLDATLTALDDGTESVGRMGQTYPEFDVFVNMQPSSPHSEYDAPPTSPPLAYNGINSPTSPYWSVDGALGNGPDDEEYLNDRRRWQDEANDIGLVTAPSHISSYAAGHEEPPGHSSEESENGWSDESDSHDGRRVVHIRSID